MADSYTGEIRMFGGTFAPMDWAFCDGQALPIAQYAVLFSLIGTTYGGDGVNSFNLPDLRGRLPMHQGSGYTIGQAGGQETVVLQANQVPVHTHVVRAKSGNGDKDTPSGNVWAATPDGRYSTATPSLAMKSSAVGNAGGGQAHDNIMPYLAVNFIICLNGYYPTRN
jgi:microcystin-dependent protein